MAYNTNRHRCWKLDSSEQKVCNIASEIADKDVFCPFGDLRAGMKCTIKAMVCRKWNVIYNDKHNSTDYLLTDNKTGLAAADPVHIDSEGNTLKDADSEGVAKGPATSKEVVEHIESEDEALEERCLDVGEKAQGTPEEAAAQVYVVSTSAETGIKEAVVQNNDSGKSAQQATM